MPFKPSGVTPPGSHGSERRDLFGLSGRAVSHFRVLEPLGAGGMGVVYGAEDTRLGRAVALKFLLPQYGFDDVAKERFLLEARSVAALDHPNICTVHEVGETEDGQLYLAMALYPGETLSARLAREGPLDTQEALAIASQIARASAMRMRQLTFWSTCARSRTSGFRFRSCVSTLAGTRCAAIRAFSFCWSNDDLTIRESLRGRIAREVRLRIPRS